MHLIMVMTNIPQLEKQEIKIKIRTFVPSYQLLKIFNFYISFPPQSI